VAPAAAQSGAQNQASLARLSSIAAKPAGDQYEGVTMARDDELADAKLAAAEARTDTKIARLEGKLDLVLESVRTFRAEVLESGNITRSEGRDNRRAVIANQWVIYSAIVVILGIIIAVIAAAPVVFDLGSKWRETLSLEVKEQLQRAQPAQPSTPTPPNRPTRQ
jgi:hypothetical protein